MCLGCTKPEIHKELPPYHSDMGWGGLLGRKGSTTKMKRLNNDEAVPGPGGNALSSPPLPTDMHAEGRARNLPVGPWFYLLLLVANQPH